MGRSDREVDFFDAKSDVEALLNLSKEDFKFEAAEHPALQMGQTAKIMKGDINWMDRCYVTKTSKEVIDAKSFPV